MKTHFSRSDIETPLNHHSHTFKHKMNENKQQKNIMDLLVKSYHQLSAIGSIIVLNGLNFEFSSFMNFLVNLRTNSVGSIY